MRRTFITFTIDRKLMRITRIYTLLKCR